MENVVAIVAALSLSHYNENADSYDNQGQITFTT